MKLLAIIVLAMILAGCENPETSTDVGNHTYIIYVHSPRGLAKQLNDLFAKRPKLKMKSITPVSENNDKYVVVFEAIIPEVLAKDF